MSFTKLNSKETKSHLSGNDGSSLFKQYPEKIGDIQQGMTPKEIADIVSNRLIDLVKQQFEIAKKEYQTKVSR